MIFTSSYIRGQTLSEEQTNDRASLRRVNAGVPETVEPVSITASVGPQSYDSEEDAFQQPPYQTIRQEAELGSDVIQ